MTALLISSSPLQSLPTTTVTTAVMSSPQQVIADDHLPSNLTITSLHTGHSFWYMRRKKNNSAPSVPSSPPPADASISSGINTDVDGSVLTAPSNNQSAAYESSIRPVCTFRSVEAFWSVYDRLVRPSALPNTTDVHVFREGIKPTWEDPANAVGGKWVVRIRKGLAARYWEEVVLAVVGEQFTAGPAGACVRPDEVCGAVLSLRYTEDIISVWNRNRDDTYATERIKATIKKVLRLPPHVNMEYRSHQAPDKGAAPAFRTSVTELPLRGGTPRGGVVPAPTLENAVRRGSGGALSSWGEPKTRVGTRDTERAWR